MAMNLVYKAENGAVALVYPAPDFAGDLRDLAALAVPEAAPWRITEVPDAPADRWRWTDSGALDVAPDICAALPREDFCVALMAAGILTEAEASDAALGTWPPKFEPALAGKDLVEKLTIKNQWRDVKIVARDAPLFLDLLDYYARAVGLTSVQMVGLGDKIFAAKAG